MKYWAYINDEIKGPFEIDELIKLDGFSSSTLVCPFSSVEEETKEWKEAGQVSEIAIHLTGKLKPSEKKEDISSQSLSKPKDFEKQEIIIERFGVENIFNLVTEPLNLKQSLDPLTLSQIRKKEEDILKIIDKQEDLSNIGKVEEKGVQESFEEQKKDEQIVLKEDKLINEQTNTVGDIDINEIEIPSTDELLKEEKKETLNQDGISSFIPKNDNLMISKDVIDDIVSKILSVVNEKISSLELKISQTSQEPQTQIDIEKIKEDIKSEVIASIDEKIAMLSLKPQAELSPNDSARSYSDIRETITHLDIEIRHLKAKIENIENKLNIAVSTRELQPSSQQSISNTNRPTTQDKNNQEQTTKEKANTKNVLVSIMLGIVALGGILFALSQFGIIDIYSIFAKKDNPAIQSQLPLNVETSTHTITSSEISKDTSSIVQTPQSTSTFSLTTLTENQQPTQQEFDVDKIISEVKSYKLNSPYDLGKTVESIIKAKKADLSNVKWEASKVEDEKILVMVSAKGKKTLEFRFEYEPKNKILKPLNTLARNTLNMMIESKKVKLNQKGASKTSKKLSQKKEGVISDDTLKKPEKSDVSVSESSGGQNQGEEDSVSDVLLIGE